jgi:hypothetical protein
MGDFGGILTNDLHFNPQRDTIAFTSNSFTERCWKAFLGAFSNREDLPIKTLAFDSGSFVFYGAWRSILPLMSFPHLEELFVVMGPDEDTKTGLISELKALDN